MSTATYDAQLRPRDNVVIEHFDRNGNRKAVFQEHRLGAYLVKYGYLSPLWINQWYAPLLSPFVGYWSTGKAGRNLITNAGFALAAGRLNGSGSPAAATYIALGTGTNAANVSDTTLQTESATAGLSRTNGTVSLVTTTVTNDTAQVTNTFTVSGSVAVTESGVLNASSTGTLLCRQVFSAVNVVNGDSLAITWKIKQS